MAFEYECNSPEYRHYLAHPTKDDLTICPAWVNGDPCPYTLRRIGAGSKAANASKSDASPTTTEER